MFRSVFMLSRCCSPRSSPRQPARRPRAPSAAWFATRPEGPSQARRFASSTKAPARRRKRSAAPRALSRDDLAPGQYRVEATLDGFEPAVARGAVDGRQAASIDVTLTPARFTEGVVVTARRVEEAVQEVPIPVSVLSGELVASAGAFNVNRVKELIPTVQFYSSNPRNSAVTIRGIGSPFGLTNDGIEPGVGLYIDGVFYARPAAATLDFLDVAQVEVLARTAGNALRQEHDGRRDQRHEPRPNFTPEANVEVAYGSFNFVQTKASVSGPLSDKVAATRLVLGNRA